MHLEVVDVTGTRRFLDRCPIHLFFRVKSTYNWLVSRHELADRVRPEGDVCIDEDHIVSIRLHELAR